MSILSIPDSLIGRAQEKRNKLETWALIATKHIARTIVKPVALTTFEFTDSSCPDKNSTPHSYVISYFQHLLRLKDNTKVLNLGITKVGFIIDIHRCYPVQQR